MKTLVAALLTLSIGATAVAGPQAHIGMAATAGEHTAETLKQLERDWAAAEEAGDSDKIGRIVADDWTGVYNEGRKLTKEQLLEQVKKAKGKTMAVELGPMDVKVLGDVAVVQGSDVDKDTSGAEIWMDVFANRDGKWVAVRSESARTGTISRPRWPI